MTTRAEEIAGDGPYTVRYDKGRYVLDGPTPTVGFWALEEWDAQNHADDLNAAYKQGQQDRWIPVSQFKAPAPGTTILFGSKNTVRMWTWDANNDEPPSSWATHCQLIELPPNPEQR